ncbi:myb-related protein Pp2-like [Dorcoceras hygrometricum]|nr:myb-related protein Pp2-like [Dorcoceras hygrometricum]
MATNGSSCTRKSSSTTINNRSTLKKGPWTVSEDTILVEYVKKHGEGNWNAVQRNSGAFSADEERLIVELHAKLGNKWARMAAQLPGRTDNEIKNYWNTRFKRRQRAGLPIYPQDHQEHSSLLPLSSSGHIINHTPLLFLDTFKPVPAVSVLPPHHYMNHTNTAFTRNELMRPLRDDGGLSLSLAASNSSSSPSSLTAQPFYNQGFPSSLPMPSILESKSLNFGFSSDTCNTGMGVLELPLIQTMVPPQATPESSSSDDAELYNEMETDFIPRGKSSGLLEDLIGESEALKDKFEGKSAWNDIEGAVVGNFHEQYSDYSFGNGSVSSENNYEGMENKAEGDMINGVDDDLLINLLDNFPLSVPIPDWSEEKGHVPSNLANGTNGEIESQPTDSRYNPDAASSGVSEQERNFGHCHWNNMPSIY